MRHDDNPAGKAAAAPPPREARAWVARAWWCLAGFPASFLAAFGVGEGLAAAMGHPPGGDAEAPLGVMMASTIPALVVFAAPAFASWWCARRAAAGGDGRGRPPALIATAVAVGFAALNAAAYVAGG